MAIPAVGKALAGWFLVAFCSAVSAQSGGFSEIAALAQSRAAAPFQAQSVVVPAELASLGYDAYRDIRFKADKALWRGPKQPYEVSFFHVGPHGDPVRIREITTSGVKDIAYQASDFNFGKNVLPTASWGNLSFAGFRVHTALNSATDKDELIAFLGASYFRALGAGQRYGLSARGLAVDTSSPGAEEFPRFTDFWLLPATTDAKALTLYALLDSPRLTGAYRFDITPGEQTTVQVHARIFLRAGVAPVNTLGLAPLTSMFFFGENQPRSEDFRPEVHDSDGLMMATGEGEWLWRPLQNPAYPLVTSFSMTSPKGFGLMQRDRQFSSYEDTEARYDLRPSAWVTPLGDWGAGRVELLQFRTPDETHDNVAAYWVPAQLPQPGESLDFAYQISWQGNSPQRPPNGWVVQSRRGTGYSRHSAEAPEHLHTIAYAIDFTGPALSSLNDDAPVRAIATSDANGRVLESIVYRNPANGTWRLNLRVQHIAPGKPVELRAFLQHQNHTVSETWTQLVTSP